MTQRIGIGVSYYGPAAPAHRDAIRGVKGKGLGMRELHGMAYPEMAYAELLRSALADELDAIVLVSHRAAGFTAETIRKLAEQAIQTGHVSTLRDQKRGAPPLSFTAVPTNVLLEMSKEDDRSYTNTGLLDTGFAEAARPFASPWKQEKDTLKVTSLIDGDYLTPEEAFLTRAYRAGARGDEEDLGGWNWWIYLGHSTPSLKITWGDAGKRLEHGITHNYAFCVPSFGGLDHDQQDALWQLQLAGCTIVEYRDCPYIDLARSVLTSVALETMGCDGIFFIDHDIIFRPIDALNMIAEAEARQDVVSAVYCMRKSAHALIGATATEVGREVTFFDGGGIVPALYSGLGFSAIPRAVIASLDAELPLLYSAFADCKVRPYYALDVNGSFYSGEDASFCARVQGLAIRMMPGSANPNGHDWEVKPNPERALTRHRVWLDTRVRIFHRGSYDYGIEDHSISVPRYGTVKAKLVASRAELRRFYTDELGATALTRAHGADVDAEVPHSVLEEEWKP